MSSTMYEPFSYFLAIQGVAIQFWELLWMHNRLSNKKKCLFNEMYKNSYVNATDVNGCLFIVKE